MKNLPKFEIQAALAFTAMVWVWMLVERVSGLHGEHIAQHPTYTNLFALPAILFYGVALSKKRKQLGGTMTWKQGFISGLWISLGVAALSPLSQWVIHTYLSPNFFATVIRHAVATQQMDETAARAYFSLSNYCLMGSIGALVMGLVTSAIVALVVRRRA